MSDASTPAGIYLCTGPLKHSWVSAEDAAKCCNGYQRERRVSHDEDGNAKLEFFWLRIETEPVEEPDIPPDIIQPLPLSALDGDDDEEPLNRGGLSHGAFFRRVAEITDDNSPAWRALTAGLLVLRLVDRWATRNITNRKVTVKELVLVRRTIQEVDDDRVHEVLTNMTDALREFSVDDVGSIPKLLFAYGLLLEESGEWPLAIDVYETLLEQAHRPDEHEGIPLVYLRLGLCHRHLGRNTQASAIYQRGLRVARMLCDTPGALRIRVSEADLAMEQGDLENAREILDGVIAEARPGLPSDREPRAHACHDRGIIAMRLGQYEAAAPLLCEALVGYTIPRDQIEALADLAVTLSAIGARDGARDALLILYDMTEQPDLRINAAINLMRLAAEDGNVQVFEEWRTAIESGPLATPHKAHFYFRLGEGYQRLGQPQTASLAYRVLAMLARDNELADYAVRAEAGLRGDPPAPAPEMARMSPAVTAVVAKLAELKRSAVFGGPSS